MTRDRKTNIRLRLLDHAVQANAYSTVLSSLSQGISAAKNRVHFHQGSFESEVEIEIAELIADEEVINIEHLIGTAFVSCQPWITSITKQATLLSHIIKESKTPESIRNFPPMFDADMSNITIIWGLANFYKHRGEGKIKPRTQTVMNKLGLVDKSTGNLREAADKLGLISYQDLHFLEGIVRDWGEQVRYWAYSKC